MVQPSQKNEGLLVTTAVGKLYNAMVRFFQAENLQFEAEEENQLLRLSIKGENGHWQSTAQVLEDTEQFLFYSILPDLIPKRKYALIIEFITRVNYGLNIGCFEMDLDTGEIRYKTALDVEGHVLSQALLKNAVYINLHIINRYLPGIKAILERDGVSPAEEVERIERQEDL